MIGTHHLIDLHGIQEDLLCNTTLIRDLLRGACAAGNLTIISEHSHTFPGHGGITALFLLAESHISIHTYPEYRYAAVDIFSCGSRAKPEQALAHIIHALQPHRHTISVNTRGEYATLSPTHLTH